ncbi:LemA family protein [Granulicoccus phenolivorans]|uniref:LemA family protein n=1 Tax=Granulicoccus phenolivorans TaxID=266854 RepID=UPI00040AF6B1|nr:LemA family protein [Granulicoccus phenolivorans]
MNWIIVLVLIVLIVLLVAGLAAMVAYTNFQYQRTAIKEAWKRVDGRLQGRYDAIAELTRLVRRYAPAETRITDEVDALRQAAQELSITEGTAPSDRRADAERELTVAVRGLLSLGYAYPDLAGNRNFLAAQQTLAQEQKQLSNNRKQYNQLVEAYNGGLEQNRGTRWVAHYFKFSPAMPFGTSAPAQPPVPAGAAPHPAQVRPEQARPEQARPAQPGPEQTRPAQTRPVPVRPAPDAAGPTRPLVPQQTPAAAPTQPARAPRPPQSPPVHAPQVTHNPPRALRPTAAARPGRS